METGGVGRKWEPVCHKSCPPKGIMEVPWELCQQEAQIGFAGLMHAGINSFAEEQMGKTHPGLAVGPGRHLQGGKLLSDTCSHWGPLGGAAGSAGSGLPAGPQDQWRAVAIPAHIPVGHGSTESRADTREGAGDSLPGSQAICMQLRKPQSSWNPAKGSGQHFRHDTMQAQRTCL